MPTIAYATDEDLALRASSDFSILCPRDQKVAVGEDGFFSVGDRWTLSSASVDFLAQGASAGQVVLLTKPSTVFRSPGEIFAIQAVQTGAVLLRRKGQPSGVGQPPSPTEGLQGVEFSIATLAPQIASATLDVNRRFGIDSNPLIGRPNTQLVDPGELRDSVVLTVLHRLYLDLSRETGANRDTFASKAFAIRAELDEVLARLAIHFLSTNSTTGVDLVTRFQTRISR